MMELLKKLLQRYIKPTVDDALADFHKATARLESVIQRHAEDIKDRASQIEEHENAIGKARAEIHRAERIRETFSDLFR